MKIFYPKLVKTMKNYKMQQLPKDILAGVIVAIIAFPLSIALAIASGMTPERGLYSAIVGGFFVSFFGGSRVNIGGVTAATVMTVFGIVSEFGLAGLAVASVMAGVILIFMGLLRFGALLKFIPRTITLGFTAAIGIGIFTGQIKGFLGLDMDKIPVTNVDRMIAYALHINTIDYVTLGIGIVAVAILLVTPKVVPKVPNSLVAILVTTIGATVLKLDTPTIGSVYGKLPTHFPKFEVPEFTSDIMVQLLPSAFTLAILIAIVTLLACVVTDGLTGHRHDSNQELMAQGIANIFCGFFGAAPVAGAVARASNNVKNGGKTPIAGIVHSIVVLFILLVMMPLAEYIPMSALAAVLIVVAYNMCNFKEIIYIAVKAPKADFIVLMVTLLVGTFVNLLSAVEAGLVVTSLLFIYNMSNLMSVKEWDYYGSEDDPDAIAYKQVPKETFVFEINGPMFFAATDKLGSIPTKNSELKTIILRMRAVPVMDVSALYFMEQTYDACRKDNITLIFSHVQEQPMGVMKKTGFFEKVGKENFCVNIDAALERAKEVNEQEA